MTAAPPCQTCGRAAHDWRSRDAGPKDMQRRDREDRAISYKKWHRKLGEECLCHDVDGIEWRRVNGELVPVAVIELTRFDGAPNLPDAYLRSVETRLFERDGQGNLILRTAALLGVPAYMVVFSEELSEFYVLDMGRRKWWKRVPPDRLERWLKGLKPPAQTGASA